MAQIYCPDCGYKNQYSINPPNFCGGCGAKLGVSGGEDAGHKKPSSPKRVAKARGGRASSRRSNLEEGEYDEDSTDIHEVPDIRKLSVDINMGGNRVIKGSDIGRVNKEDVVR